MALYFFNGNSAFIMMAQVSRPLIRANICGPLAKLPTLFYTARHSNSFSFVIWGFSWFGNSESLTPSQIALIFKKTNHNSFLPSVSGKSFSLSFLKKFHGGLLWPICKPLKTETLSEVLLLKTQHLKHAEQHLDRPDLYGEQRAQLFGHIYWRYIYRSIDIYTYIFREREREGIALMKRTPWGWGYCALGWCHRKHCMDKREEQKFHCLSANSGCKCHAIEPRKCNWKSGWLLQDDSDPHMKPKLKLLTAHAHKYFLFH